ncbi:4-hydroxy-tetrahydrodipicolinate reductase [subsurface metagenome]
MKIALIGYGRMGKEIEAIALKRNHEIVLKIDIDNPHEFSIENLQEADVAIDFSVPSSAYTNIMRCFNANVPVVCGTTGWLDKYTEIVNTCKKKNCTFFYASNFSVGVNLLFKLNKHLAKMMNKLPDYDVEIEEIHHIHKLDTPSGTAITLAKSIIEELERKKDWKPGTDDNKQTIHITSKRENEIPGIHAINYESEVDFIEIRHSAKSRKGFAVGAVLAAEFIYNKKGVYSMDDMMEVE